MTTTSPVKNPIIWFEIYVSNMDRAKKFYETVFELTMAQIPFAEGQMWGFPSNPEKWGCSGTLVQMAGFTPGNNSTIIYFSSSNCSIEEKRVLAAGGKIQKSKMSIGQFGFISLAYDTEGNIFGIHSME